MAITAIKLTFEEFCQLPESVLPHELIDGELRMPAAPNWRHQRILWHVARRLGSYVEDLFLGYIVMSPIDVVLDRDRPLVLQPDLVYISRARASIIRDKIYGAPDLTVEIFSGSGALFDRTEKAALYAKYGVREYWLVDPEAEVIEVRRLEAHGYETVGRFGRGDALRSTLFPGLHLPIDPIFAD